MTGVSAIIPTLNEAAHLAATIDAARTAGVAEIIVSDGGSLDRTVEIARSRGARVITGDRIRARQLNRGAEEASHDALLFLHADTLLPHGAADAIGRAIDDGFEFGGFRIAFIEPHLRLRYVAFMVNARTRMIHAPWGDQGQFARRDAFARAGGYPDFPIMEDYELARRMRRAGRTTLLPLTVRTSGRRFLGNGVVRTSIVNWTVIAGYHLGVSPDRLAKWYRGARAG